LVSVAEIQTAATGVIATKKRRRAAGSNLTAPFSVGLYRAKSMWSDRHQSIGYLIAKSSFLSLVPFISSRIQIGVMPRPDHFTLLSFLL
jgi:hypothetical protein